MKNQRVIYALCCPFTDNIHYIGKSTNGMTRPFSHINNSHSDKINDWVKDLAIINNRPNVKILEYVPDEIDINDREVYYIQKYIYEGAILLNSALVKPITISRNLNEYNGDVNIQSISKFVKERRKMSGMTQEELSEKSAIALTVIRKIEQGKTNINLESLLNVLKLFGSSIGIVRINRE